jgi:hypothetical protein
MIQTQVVVALGKIFDQIASCEDVCFLRQAVDNPCEAVGFSRFLMREKHA